MAQIELIMPKMGESIMEATILKWLKKEGDSIEAEESVLEIATDKVDSDVPSPVDGVLEKILFDVEAVVDVGTAIAIIRTTDSGESEDSQADATVSAAPPVIETASSHEQPASSEAANNGFYSPLVLNMARQEGVAMEVLASIPGTGKDKRLTKRDMLAYLKNRTTSTATKVVQAPPPPVVKKSTPVASTKPAAKTPKRMSAPPIDTSGNVEIVEMSRMRKLIADHMVMSKQVSPHVTSFVEVDVTNIVNWRNRIKKDFQAREGEKITFTPIFVEACTNAIKDFPLINSSVDGKNVIIRKDINIGMATATPSGELIVPVIRHADRQNLLGLTKTVNDLARRARNSKLKPHEIQGGTFTLTNVGSFGSLMGTPIINQPQVAILAVGAIRKKPAVLETEYGDVIAIRQLMIMSLSYDHRIVDGALGSQFLKRVADNLEAFDVSRKV